MTLLHCDNIASESKGETSIVLAFRDVKIKYQQLFEQLSNLLGLAFKQQPSPARWANCSLLTVDGFTVTEVFCVGNVDKVPLGIHCHFGLHPSLSRNKLNRPGKHQQDQVCGSPQTHRLTITSHGSDGICRISNTTET